MQLDTVHEKLAQAPASSFHVLDPAKAKRFNAKTMFIPSPHDVARAIAEIPSGETRTILDLRRSLALKANAETTCPAVTIKSWKWIASAAEDGHRAEPEYQVPWWRVLKDGNPSRHMPGGEQGQILRLGTEGVHISR